MRKMCVKRAQWVLVAVIAATISQTFIGTTTSAQSAEPLLLPRLSFGDLSYAGGFRLPAEANNGETFARGGKAVAFNAANASLFISSFNGQVAEVSIPSPVISADVNEMPFAQYLQGFYDPTEGNISQVASWGVWTNSLLVHDGRLYGTASMYYDANNEQRVSHYSRSLRLNQRSFSGWSEVWETGKAGFVSGLLAAVPAEWQPRLGGPMVSGQCCVPIVSRTSWGPAAFAFNPGSIGQRSVAASPLLYYTQDHPTLGSWHGTSETWGQSTEMGGLVLVAGTRTALYFGRTGIGAPCYGPGTNDPKLHGVPVPPSGTFVYCYDPTGVDSQGVHAYPYRYQIWAYDLNDLAAVRAGTKKPWEVVPYDVWPFAFPTQDDRISIGGVSYDASTQTIFVAQNYADTDVFESRPIIHALRVKATGAALPAPITEVPVNPMTGLSVRANKAAPQKPGAAITFSATALGGDAANQFKWLVLENGSWETHAEWSTANTFTWTPSAASSQYQIAVWGRSGRSTVDKAQALASMYFPIEDANNANPVTAVTLAANRAAPQRPGTAVTFSASASGGTGRHNFKWLVYDGSQWRTHAEWSGANTFTWAPSSANSQYQVRVWARNGQSAADQPQATATMPFSIESPTIGGAPVSSVIVSSTVSPQPVGTVLQFVANPTGGTAPHQFKWRTFDGATWTVQADWGASNRFTWTPPTASSGYRIEVWVRSAGNTADTAEASLTMPFVVTAR